VQVESPTGKPVPRFGLEPIGSAENDQLIAGNGRANMGDGHVASPG
jgi:hypothetical protein